MFQNILQSISVKILVAIINFCVLIISSKYLGVSSRGEISIFILNLSIIQGINEVFTGYSIIYFVPKFNFKKIFVSGLIFTLIFCSLSNVLLNLLNKQVKGYENLAYIISLLVILNTFNSMLLLGKEAIKSFNILAFFQPFTLLLGILVSVFYFKSYTFQSYIYPLLFSFLLAFIGSSYALYQVHQTKQTNQTPFHLSQILTNGFYFQAAFLLLIFCNRLSFYVLSDTKKVGLYAAACMLMESVLLIVNSLAPVLISKIANQSKQANSADYTLRFVKLAFISSALFIFVLAFIPESVFVFFLGAGFTGVKSLMLAYAPAILMMSVFSVINQYFSGIGKQKFILLSNAFGFLATLVFAPFFIDRFDTIGAAYTANISYAVIFILSMTLFVKSTKINLLQFFEMKNDFVFFKRLIKNESDI